jgi:hypothetical protein
MAFWKYWPWCQKIGKFRLFWVLLADWVFDIITWFQLSSVATCKGKKLYAKRHIQNCCWSWDNWLSKMLILQNFDSNFHTFF